MRCIIILITVAIITSLDMVIAQPDAESTVKVIRLNESIGDTVDAVERQRYHLFGSFTGFKYAVITQLPDGNPAALITVVQEGEEKVLTQPYTWTILNLLREQIQYLAKTHTQDSLRSVKRRLVHSADSISAALSKLIWVNFGAGLFLHSPKLMLGGSISIHKTSGGSNKVFICRFVRGEAIVRETNTSWKRSVWDLGVLGGGISKGRFGFISVAAGLAITGGSNDNHRFTTIGIPLELHASRLIVQGLGSGLELCANLNQENSFLAVNYSLQFGKLHTSEPGWGFK
ncbi:MAG: hypothetical protein HQ568_11660 [Calditrichaeota bacterium]|nr:hypothetical protein [Calditrichota bacterium]